MGGDLQNVFDRVAGAGAGVSSGDLEKLVGAASGPAVAFASAALARLTQGSTPADVAADVVADVVADIAADIAADVAADVAAAVARGLGDLVRDAREGRLTSGRDALAEVHARVGAAAIFVVREGAPAGALGAVVAEAVRDASFPERLARLEAIHLWHSFRVGGRTIASLAGSGRAQRTSIGRRILEGSVLLGRARDRLHASGALPVEGQEELDLLLPKADSETGQMVEEVRSATADLEAARRGLDRVLEARANHESPDEPPEVTASRRLIAARENALRRAETRLDGALRPAIVRQAAALLARSGHDPEACAQKTLLKVFQHLAELRDCSSAAGWARQITFAEAMSMMRPPPPPKPTVDPYWGTTSEDPESLVDSRAELRRLEAALRRMPTAYRTPFLMRYAENMSIESIAEHLGLSRANTDQRLTRARAFLKRHGFQRRSDG